MNGVDILAMEEIAVEFAFNWTAWWITVAIFGVIGLIASIYFAVRDGCHWIFVPLMTTVLTLFGMLFGVTSAKVMWPTPTKFEPQYKVTISEEVKITEFLEKYEIIETEGKIYTVREKGE